eukprot:356044-Chlamydomonas_euryale.AAC.1
MLSPPPATVVECADCSLAHQPPCAKPPNTFLPLSGPGTPPRRHAPHVCDGDVTLCDLVAAALALDTAHRAEVNDDAHHIHGRLWSCKQAQGPVASGG